ncbi:MAG: hypothetical protein V1806_08005 [Pseudomonadota bacterium]
MRLNTHTSSDVNPDTLPPIFSLEHMQRGFCIDNCDSQGKAQFADALWKRSKMPWAQLRVAPRHGLGYEKIQNLNATLPNGIHEDVNIISFRCIGKAPMVGYRKDRVFYILWIDLSFSVYDHS